MIRPLVTVVMATYNQATYLRQALDSLMAQTLSLDDFEVIVINDGSTEETSEILQDYKGWINLIERENKGMVVSCNEGLALARGSFFARLDSDDFVAPEWLEYLVRALQANLTSSCAYPDRYELHDGQWIYIKVQPDNLYTLEACGTLIRTNMLKEVGGFRPFYWEEYDLYLRLSQVGKFIHVPYPFYVYRKHANSLTYDASKRIEGWLELAEEWGIERLKTAGLNPDLDRVFQILEERSKRQ